MNDLINLKANGVPATSISVPFLQGMVNRIAVSHHKYGDARKTYPDKANAVASLKVRLEKYERTGNTEWLIDVANFAMLEFLFPSHPTAHYRATDSNESPGLVWR